mgnify:CR=1 FL=1
MTLFISFISNYIDNYLLFILHPIMKCKPIVNKDHVRANETLKTSQTFPTEPVIHDP